MTNACRTEATSYAKKLITCGAGSQRAGRRKMVESTPDYRRYVCLVVPSHGSRMSLASYLSSGRLEVDGCKLKRRT